MAPPSLIAIFLKNAEHKITFESESLKYIPPPNYASLSSKIIFSNSPSLDLSIKMAPPLLLAIFFEKFEFEM